MNYLNLINWLVDNTRINNDESITNSELRDLFLKAFPDYNSIAENTIAFKIGLVLNLIYGSELINDKSGDSTAYNIEII